MTSKEKAIQIATILSDKKGEDVKIIEIRDLTTIADYFVISTATSNTHVKSLRDNVDEKMKEKEVYPSHNEGGNGSNWLLMDYGDVVVHIFDREAAEFYDLERLWSDAPEVQF